MKETWLFVDNVPRARLTTYYKCVTAWHSMGTHRFRKNETHNEIIAWAKETFAGVKYDVRWYDAKADNGPKPVEKIYGDHDL